MVSLYSTLFSLANIPQLWNLQHLGVFKLNPDFTVKAVQNYFLGPSNRDCMMPVCLTDTFCEYMQRDCLAGAAKEFCFLKGVRGLEQFQWDTMRQSSESSGSGESDLSKLPGLIWICAGFSIVRWDATWSCQGAQPASRAQRLGAKVWGVTDSKSAHGSLPVLGYRFGAWL